MEVRSVTVNVAGQSLSIRTDATDEELKRLSDLVDSRVNMIQAASRSAPPSKVYLLAALAVADELRQSQAELLRLRESVSQHAQGVLQFLEQDAGDG